MAAGLRATALALGLGMILGAAPAKAVAHLEAGLGASYWFDRTGVFDLNLAVRGGIARHLSLGGRFGALIATPSTVGVPLDLQLRANVGRAYLEGMAGPWILFGTGTPVRAHAAFGFGLLAGFVNLGLEVGWLQSAPMLGFRLAFPI